MGEGKRGDKREHGGGNRTKTRWLSCSNRYNLIMQVLGWARDRHNRSSDEQFWKDFTQKVSIENADYVKRATGRRGNHLHIVGIVLVNKHPMGRPALHRVSGLPPHGSASLGFCCGCCG